jgi:hypothetical protein
MRRWWAWCVLLVGLTSPSWGRCPEPPLLHERVAMEWHFADAVFVGVAGPVEDAPGASGRAAIPFEPLVFLRGVAAHGRPRVHSDAPGLRWEGYPFQPGMAYIVVAFPGDAGRWTSYEDSLLTAPLADYALLVLVPGTFLLTVLVMQLCLRPRGVAARV